MFIKQHFWIPVPMRESLSEGSLSRSEDVSEEYSGERARNRRGTTRLARRGHGGGYFSREVYLEGFLPSLSSCHPRYKDFKEAHPKRFPEPKGGKKGGKKGGGKGGKKGAKKSIGTRASGPQVKPEIRTPSLAVAEQHGAQEAMVMIQAAYHESAMEKEARRT